MSVHPFGIRHHGPGSARSLARALKDLQPDLVLIEGPADAQEAIPLAAHAGMKPPVALLVYTSEDSQDAVYYPLAVFSPEWQAIQYGLKNEIPVRWIDLPQTHQFALARQWRAQAEQESESDQETEDLSSESEESIDEIDDPITDEGQSDPALEWLTIRQDPLSWLARSAGYPDGESWWEHVVEQRQDSTDVFIGIAEAMGALRQEVEALQTELATSLATPPSLSSWADQRESLREAYMRQSIRTAEKEGFQTIAVICGAWHVPVLQDLPPAKADQKLLKGLPKVKTHSTWVPWTYERLSFASGYGAGIYSPGWYHHLWSHPRQVSVHWITRVARLLRQEDLDASSASAIEAVRLAETLAALRDQPRPGLEELNEAVRTVLCFGDPTPLKLIHDRLIVSNRLGVVPDETPAVPLQQDLQRQQKRLRLKPDPTSKSLELDLRKPNDLERSQLLHRLTLLGVPWGQPEQLSGTGTFKEGWRLQWHPEFVVRLIEAGIWGNTVAEASLGKTYDRIQNAPDLPHLTELLDQVILANLPKAVDQLMVRLQAEAAIASDITHLMNSLPSLANILRYSDVRNTDTQTLTPIVEGLVTRICIGLPSGCASLDDDAAHLMFDQIIAVNTALRLLQQDDHLQEWHKVLKHLSDQQGLHGLLAGRCCRLLLDAREIDGEESARRLEFTLSRTNDPAVAAAWIDGLLRGSGLLLLHNENLWSVLDHWITSLLADDFTATLPLIRRTFSTFPAPERRQMGELVKQGQIKPASPSQSEEIDPEAEARGNATLPLLAQLLGVQL